MICLFIDVAIEMHELRNFAGLSSVITALCIDMIARLRQSWALVPQEMSDRLQALRRIYDSAGLYSAYMTLFQGIPAHLPVVPYLGAHTKALTVDNDQQSDTVDGKINIKKLRSMYGILLPVLQRQRIPYDHKPNRTICNLQNAALKPFYFHFIDDRERMTELLMQKAKTLEAPVYVEPEPFYGGEEGYPTEMGDFGPPA